MAKRGRPKKTEIQTRDPIVSNRDPATHTRPYKPRRYIKASDPCVCPDCGGVTRMANGKHVDPVKRTILEYRTCSHCGMKLAAGRNMVEHEIKKYCEFEDAVKDYEQSK